MPAHASPARRRLALPGLAAALAFPLLAHAAPANLAATLSNDTLSADTPTGTTPAGTTHVLVAIDNPATPLIAQPASYRATLPEPDDAQADDTQADATDPDAAIAPDTAPATAHATGALLQTGVASYYGRAWAGRRTASGTTYNPNELTAASHTLPLGTRVWVTLEDTARSVLVTITDRQGTARRIIDLSTAAARRIGLISRGTGRVTLRRA